MGNDGYNALGHPSAAAATGAASAQLRTIALCDLADSTALVERLGDRRAAELFRAHDRIARDLLVRHGGREIDKTDGFLALFDRPVAAVAFALAYQSALRELGRSQGEPLAARVGIHVGDVVVWENSSSDIAQGAKRVEVEGLAKPVAARLMGLARPGQILLSGMAQNLARRAEGELGELAERVRWPTHGRYRFKGVPAPMLVHEVGEVGVAPLKPPRSGAKARRELPLWRQPGALALEALAVLAVVAIAIALTARTQSAIAFGERDWAVVGDLRNLGTDPRTADALETAFRLSLEQSRFVNLLPDLRVRDALERMQREPGTEVDRDVASEIALREGARVVILPTLAELGGRVRFSTEIVDPRTQTTVFAEANDALPGGELAAVDAMAAQLRGRLGEALRDIEAESVPLPRISGGDMKALELYAEGHRLLESGDADEALLRFDAALSVDPGFALAHVGRARALYVLVRGAEARQAIDDAAAHTDRLTSRDRLYVEAWQANFEAPTQGVRKWRLLTELYPDHFAGRYNLALFSWVWLNDPEACVEQAAQLDQSQNPDRRSGVYLHATCLMALDRLQEADALFSRSMAMGESGLSLAAAERHSAMGDVGRALEELAARARTGEPRVDAQLDAAIAVAHFDLGQFEQAFDQLGKAADAIEDEDAFRAVALRIQAIAARAAVGEAAKADDLDAAYADLLRVGVEREYGEGALALASLAHAALWSNQTELANRMLGSMPAPQLEHYPVLASLDEGLRAQVEQRNASEVGREGTALLADAARFRLLARQGMDTGALRAAIGLAQQPGRAYTESGTLPAHKLLNVAEVRLARLHAAEFAVEAGEPDIAAEQLAAFLAHWPKQRLPSALLDRVAAVESALPPVAN